jgi:3-oxoacyl-[acyl-carrier protein] reductase
MNTMAKTVFITGASGGIGNAIFTEYMQHGYNIIAPTIEELDLSSRESIDSYFENNKNLCVDILINNAGVNFVNDIDRVITDDMDQMMSINLLAPIILIRSLVGNMKKNGFGRIVNISSIWSEAGRPGRSIYAATKRGLNGITQTLAVELAQYGILVNSVSPGFTLTELTLATNTLEQLEQLKSKVPLGRLAQPEEIAKVVFFLGNENNTYLTGQNIVVDGGYTSL